ncbi:hypothetical protein AB2B38_007730, partial [Balneola sp. MJW-20]|uniref:hypothetical protein n=1 Tax=Gracilimonas aurantiaca TaxID=3234185 RepID=UPI003908C9C7
EGCKRVPIPPNARLDDSGHDWECIPGYYKGKFDSEGCKRVPIPPNARLDDSGHDWECIPGYHKKNYTSNICSKIVIPDNASLTSTGKEWECNRGYYKEHFDSKKCTEVIVPENASLNYYGTGWQCNFPYSKRDDICISPKNATDEEIARLIIRQSISSYSGNCPCPYNADRAGRRCGGRSAYSRAGGYSPICYVNQVSKTQIVSFRAKHILLD